MKGFSSFLCSARQFFWCVQYPLRKERYFRTFDVSWFIMIFTKIRHTLIVIFILWATIGRGQDKPIGYWESLLPYTTCVGVATDGNLLYAASAQAFFIYNVRTNETQEFSKVEGMSDLGMQAIGYDMSTSTVVLAYSDGNIDLFKNSTFYNIPDFKLQNIPGAKTINSVYTENGIAYLSTSVGVIVIDLADQVDSGTVSFYADVSGAYETVPVISFSSTDSFYYAATSNGVYSIGKTNIHFKDYQYWQIVDSTDSITDLATINNTLYLSNHTKVFELVGNTVQTVYVSDSGVQHIDAGNGELLIGENSNTGGRIKIMTVGNNIVDSFECPGPTVQAVELLDSSYWVAMPTTGLNLRTEKVYANTVYPVKPYGPSDAKSFDIYAYNGNVYIAHGGYNQLYGIDNDGNDISYLHDKQWTYYQQYLYQPFNNILDMVALTMDQSKGILYAGSFQDGLFAMNTANPNNSYQQINQNSIFGPSLAYGPNYHQIVGLALDQSDNLWITEMFSDTQLYVKTADSQWYAFYVPNISRGGPIVIDDYGQIWFASDAGDGVSVYNTNGTISDKSDDATYHLSTGVGNGNLPVSNTNCLAKDQNNNIWIGTTNGIAIASNCNAPFSNTPPCDAEIPIVQYDQYAGYLFAGYNVTSIAVDGANRKWVGTDNGIWLLSPDASQIVYYFTADNSPLPSNNIQKISIDPITGDVYIGTDMGLISYRSTATLGGTSNQSVLVFPNPVTSNYTGTVAIKGLVANADVRITDITGQLVYRTTAFGGQAVWNGKDYTGHRPQSGVYLIFVASSDGSQTYVGKVVFIQ